MRGRSELQLLKNYIATNNLRYTPQREVILDLFLQSEGHINADDLYKKVEGDHPEIGIATVRRSLNLFVKCKIANKVRFGDGKTVYEHKHSHHDHLICISCGKILEFRNDEIEKLQEEVAKKNNFTVSKHKLEIYGYCADCAYKTNKSEN